MAEYNVQIWNNDDGTLTVDNSLHGPLVYKKSSKTHSPGSGSIQRNPELGLSVTLPNGDVYVHSEPTNDLGVLNHFHALMLKKRAELLGEE